MGSHITLYLLAGLLTTAGPLLFLALWMAFKEASAEHPIYRGCKHRPEVSPKNVSPA